MKRPFLALCFLSCATAQPVLRSTGVLRVRSPVSDATLWVDDTPIGELGRLGGGVRLPVGVHRIELRHDARHTRYAEVAVRSGATVELDLELLEVLP